ncbi:hypothetical protein F5Y15DRAFT_333689 [Xylariaceae sp. FL0016]|nr:hypothetical protein F5Y15DRAFT_333689 [Xylariaceae sp. FL0016]
MQSRHHCNRCQQGFGSVDDLAAHQRMPMPCELRDPSPTESVTETDLSRMRLKGTEEEKWQSMYRLVFPGDERVPSPYCDEPCLQCDVPHTYDDLYQYQQRELPALIRHEMALLPPGLGHDPNHIVDMMQRLNAKLRDEFVKSKDVPSSGPDQHTTLASSSTIAREGIDAGLGAPPVPSFNGVFDFDFDISNMDVNLLPE